MSTRSPRLLVVDDSRVERMKLSRALESLGCEVTLAEGGTTAIELLHAQAFDIVLLDLEMEDAEGAEAPFRLRDHEAAKVVVFTAHKDDDHILQAVQIGINGYVMKGAPKRRLCEAIRIVARGGMYLDPAVAPKVTAMLAGRNRRAGSLATECAELTSREAAVLDSIAAGKRNKEIAAQLNISERTVKFHASSIFSKLGAKNRTEAVKIAVAKQLISL